MKKVLLLLGVVGLVLCIGAFILLKVKKITCSASGKSCAPQISQKLEGFVGKPLWSAPSAVKKSLLAEALVEKFVIHVSPMGLVNVEIVERKPEVALSISGQENVKLYTKDGIASGEGSRADLPTIVIKERVNENDIPFAVTLTYELSKIIRAQSFELVSEALVVVDSSNKKFIYPVSGDIDILLGSTLLVFSQLNDASGKLNINNKPLVVREVDFRFKNPILRE